MVKLNRFSCTVKWAERPKSRSIELVKPFAGRAQNGKCHLSLKTEAYENSQGNLRIWKEGGEGVGVSAQH